MGELFEQMRRTVREDAELAGPDEFAIISEDEHSITVWDYYNDDLDREYTITDPDVITPEWVAERTLITSSAEGIASRIDMSALYKYLCDYAMETLCTLDRMLFINDTERDFDELYEKEGGWRDILEVNDLPEELGIMWHERSMVLVNLGECERCVKEMADAGEIDEDEVGDEFNRAVVTTLLHELRHLEQSNPYMPEGVFEAISEDPEEDAEEYGLIIYEKNPACVLSEHDSFNETIER